MKWSDEVDNFGWFEEIPNMAANHDVIDMLPACVQRFIVFEQKNLWKPERLRFSDAEAELDTRYLPESCRVFSLPCYWIKRRHLYVYGGEREADEVGSFVRGESPESWVLLPIHPAELQHYKDFLEHIGARSAAEEGLRVLATPTSSTRTVLAWPDDRPDQVFFAKLSLRSRLLGNRRLGHAKVAGSIGLSEVVRQSGKDLPSGLKFFPETLGLVPRGMPDSGVIFRSVPHEIKLGKVVPAAMFSLMGGASGRLPLLCELMGITGFRVREFLEDVVVRKFANLWIDFAFGSGIFLEAHAQDLLLALSPNLHPLGDLYYRDFEGLTVDWELRRAKGIRLPCVLPHSSEWHRTYETWGYPPYQLVSCKIRTSLFDYVHFVLNELESALLEWQGSGMMVGENIREGELTNLFSRYLRRAIEDRFAMAEPEQYNIQHYLNRFVKFLMRVRREVLINGSA